MSIARIRLRVAVICAADLGPAWFVLLIELNIVFTLAGTVAWLRDSAFEARVRASQVSPSALN